MYKRVGCGDGGAGFLEFLLSESPRNRRRSPDDLDDDREERDEWDERERDRDADDELLDVPELELDREERLLLRDLLRELRLDRELALRLRLVSFDDVFIAPFDVLAKVMII